MLVHPKVCLFCSKPLIGRKGKKFCDPRCKARYHNEMNEEKPKSLFVQIDNILKQNRRILKHFNQGGSTSIRQDELHKEGFNPNHFTHYWKSKKGDVYLFCYEFGFKAYQQNGKDKYLLVHWQDYMKK